MKHLIVAATVVLPSVSLAQPAPAPAPPPSGTYPPAGSTTPPVYAITPETRNYRRGLTLEVNVGPGWVWATTDASASSDTELGLAGIDIGIGGWLTDDLALTGRIAGVTYSPADQQRLTAGFLGPSLQYWVSRRVWAGAGVGVAFAALSSPGASDSKTGFALDGRVGYVFSGWTDNSFNLSIEVTPGFYDAGGQHGFALLLGYQHL